MADSDEGLDYVVPRKRDAVPPKWDVVSRKRDAVPPKWDEVPPKWDEALR